jgi:hypothetical protein
MRTLAFSTEEIGRRLIDLIQALPIDVMSRRV